MQVEALSYEDLHGEERCESSAKMREKATAAAEIQAARYRQESIHFNSELKAGQIEKYCILEKAAEELLEDAFRRLRLSARSYHGIIRTARTIADLDRAVKIGVPHISEAICFGAPTKVYGGSDIWRWKSLQSAAGRRAIRERLMPFADMPSRLFVRGALPADEQKTAAIVGARICTAYGKSQAAFFAQVLAANGVAVISGLACGSTRRRTRGHCAERERRCRAWLRRGYLLSETELPTDAADAGKRRRCLKRISAGRRAASVAFPDPQPRDQCAGRCRSGN